MELDHNICNVPIPNFLIFSAVLAATSPACSSHPQEPVPERTHGYQCLWWLGLKIEPGFSPATTALHTEPPRSAGGTEEPDPLRHFSLQDFVRNVDKASICLKESYIRKSPLPRDIFTAHLLNPLEGQGEEPASVVFKLEQVTRVQSCLPASLLVSLLTSCASRRHTHHESSFVSNPV